MYSITRSYRLHCSNDYYLYLLYCARTTRKHDRICMIIVIDNKSLTDVRDSHCPESARLVQWHGECQWLLVTSMIIIWYWVIDYSTIDYILCLLHGSRTTSNWHRIGMMIVIINKFLMDVPDFAALRVQGWVAIEYGWSRWLLFVTEYSITRLLAARMYFPVLGRRGIDIKYA